MNDWLAFIQGVGFPAAVAFYVLHRFGGDMRDVLAELRALRRDLCDRLPPYQGGAPPRGGA